MFKGGPPRKPAAVLVRAALDRWAAHNMRADNTTVICVMFDPPGVSRTQMRHMSSISSNSTVKISDGEDSLSEYECDMGEKHTINDESAELATITSDTSGLFVTPFSPLTECKSTDNRFNCKPIFRPSPHRPIFTGRPVTPHSAPAKLATASYRYRHYGAISKLCRPPINILQSPGARHGATSGSSDTPTRSQNLFESIMGGGSTPFMDVTASSPSVSQPASSQAKMSPSEEASVDVTTNSLHIPSKQSMSPSRTLRPRSPRQAEINLPVVTSGHTRPVSPRGSTGALAFPKEATSAKSPLKINISKDGSPSTGLVSPIWPSSLEMEMGMDIGLELDVSADMDSAPFTINISDSSENIENPCCRTPDKRLLKRKAPSPIPDIKVKRTRTPTPTKGKAATPMALRMRKSPRKSN